MKKVVVWIVAAAAAIVAQGASLDWKYTATASDVDKTVYVLLGDTAKTSWESVDELSAAAVDKGTVAKAGRNGYATNGTVVDSSVTKSSASVYYVVVSADGSTFDVTSVANMAASVYDPGNQESSPGANTSLSSSSITSSGNSFGGGGGDVPEPTSGLLLLVGGAMLALRRKQK